jgi:hypothetical protein
MEVVMYSAAASVAAFFFALNLCLSGFYRARLAHAILRRNRVVPTRGMVARKFTVKHKPSPQ